MKSITEIRVKRAELKKSIREKKGTPDASPFEVAHYEALCWVLDE